VLGSEHLDSPQPQHNIARWHLGCGKAERACSYYLVVGPQPIDGALLVAQFAVSRAGIRYQAVVVSCLCNCQQRGTKKLLTYYCSVLKAYDHSAVFAVTFLITDHG